MILTLKIRDQSSGWATVLVSIAVPPSSFGCARREKKKLLESSGEVSIQILLLTLTLEEA